MAAMVAANPNPASSRRREADGSPGVLAGTAVVVVDVALVMVIAHLVRVRLGSWLALWLPSRFGAGSRPARRGWRQAAWATGRDGCRGAATAARSCSISRAILAMVARVVSARWLNCDIMRSHSTALWSALIGRGPSVADEIRNRRRACLVAVKGDREDVLPRGVPGGRPG